MVPQHQQLLSVIFKLPDILMNPKTISRSASHTDSQGRHLISLMLVLLLWCGSGSHVLCLSSVHCSFVKPHFVGREFRPRHQLLGNTEIWKPHKYRGDLETSQTKILVPSGTCWFTVLLYKHMHTNMYTGTHMNVHKQCKQQQDRQKLKCIQDPVSKGNTKLIQNWIPTSFLRSEALL